MLSFLVGIVVAAVTLYIAILYASTAIGLLAFAQAMLLVLAFAYLLYFRTRLNVSIRIPIAVVEQGRDVTVHVHVVNRSPFSGMRARFCLRAGSPFLKSQERTWLDGAAVYPGENHYSACICPQYAGSYILKLRKIRVYDMTGLFYLNRRVEKSASVQVLPAVEALSVRLTERTKNFFGDSDVYDAFRPGNDHSEIFGIREFREGDKIQSIHWKLSAKEDGLIVREDSLPLACPTVFLLTNVPRKSKNQVERYLTVAASLSFSLMAASCPHFVAWYSPGREELVRIRVDNEEGYYTFLSSYMMDGTGKMVGDVEEQYREKYRNEHPLHMLVLTDKLSLLLNGSCLATVDGRDWRETFEKLELIL